MHGERLASAVRQRGWLPQLCQTAGEVAQVLQPRSFAAVLSDDILPDADLTMVIPDIERRSLNVPVIVVSRRGEWDPSIVALMAGAPNHLPFPPYPGEVEQSLARSVSPCRSQ